MHNILGCLILKISLLSFIVYMFIMKLILSLFAMDKKTDLSSSRNGKLNFIN